MVETYTVSPRNVVLEAGGSIMPLLLKRHLAPRTVRLLMQSLPIQGSVHALGGMVYINTETDAGIERGRSRFRAGEVSFLPVQRCLCFHVTDNDSGRRMTPVGVLNGDVSALSNLGAGEMIRIHTV